MSTAQEIQRQIDTALRELQESQAAQTHAEQEIELAEERQRLRRQLDNLQNAKATSIKLTENARWRRRNIDADILGPHLPGGGLGTLLVRPRPEETKRRNSEEINCSAAVVKGEYTWRIGGVSWLVEALKQNGEDRLECKEYFWVGEDRFDFVYNPSGGDDGTLSIIHCENRGATFRYKISIKRCQGDFAQWGATGNVCFPEKEEDDVAFGPDVPEDGGAEPQGIFGLSHEALLKSEWVEDDILTIKFQIELRAQAPVADVSKPSIEIPPSLISTELLSLFDSGKYSDVTILVEGESIKAHSNILCARSDVFDRLLSGGLRESVTKEIIIDDCDALTIKALMRYLYTDDFGCIEAMIEGTRSDQASSSADRNDSRSSRITSLQSLLAASHKYGVTRLQNWCEAKVCECITVDEVCSILCQAHLYAASQLADMCLDFIRQHYERVIVTAKFGTLAKDWPEVMLKINLFMGQVREDSAVPAMEAVRGPPNGKRKREQ